MKLVILDRDGTINEDSDDFVKSVVEWKPIPGSIEAIARLSHAGFRVFIASNQSGIGRGLLDYDALFAIHDRLQRAVAEFGGHVDAIAFAPDHPDRPSELRKPSPGMLKDLARRLQVDLERVPCVGDSIRDITAARAAAARPILVRTGNGRATESTHRKELAGVEIHDDLASVATALIAAGSSPQ